MTDAGQFCLFCQIAEGRLPAHVIHESDKVIAFLDIAPIRPGHTQIIPKAHYAYFDELPGDVLNEITALGQRIARAQKAIYGVQRVGFAFTGTDIAHTHAHIVPLVETDDLTSRRYIAEEVVTYRLPSRPSAQDMAETAAQIRQRLSPGR